MQPNKLNSSLHIKSLKHFFLYHMKVKCTIFNIKPENKSSGNYFSLSNYYEANLEMVLFSKYTKEYWLQEHEIKLLAQKIFTIVQKETEGITEMWLFTWKFGIKLCGSEVCVLGPLSKNQQHVVTTIYRCDEIWAVSTLLAALENTNNPYLKMPILY